MVLTEEAAAHVTIVAIAGRLDTRTAHQFSGRLTEMLRSGQAYVLIEASRLSYISSAGFRALLIAAKLATEMGGRLAICNVPTPIRRVFELAVFDDVFATFASREDALAQWSAD